MKSLLFKTVAINDDKLKVLIDREWVDLKDLNVRYKESKLYSYLELSTAEDEYLMKGLKSIWELFRISTYDVIEKREDNRIFNLYCKIKDLKEKL